MATTSPSLLIRVRNPNDDEAWDEFSSIYTSIIRDYCMQRQLQPNDVDDVVQDVMASVFTSIRKFDYDPSKGRFRAWFGTVAANKIKNFLAKRNRRTTKSIDDDGFLHSTEISKSHRYSDPDAEWVHIFSEKIYRTASRRIRGEFNNVVWECFQALWVRGESASVVAESLGITINSAYINRYRVLKRLEAEVVLLSEDAPLDGVVD